MTDNEATDNEATGGGVVDHGVKGPEAVATPDRRGPYLALGLAILAVLVRAQHLDWGLPAIEEEAYPLKKAFAMWGWGTGRVQLDPETAGWPSLSFYVHMLLQGAHYTVGRIAGVFASRQDYFLLTLDMSPIVLIARWLGVIASAVIVFVGARLGYLLAGLGGGLLVGTALLASPVLARFAHFITPDILLAMFAALAVNATVDLLRGGRTRDYVLAGLFIGLGISTKYTPVLLLPSFYLAHLLRLREESGGRARAGLKRLGLDDRRLWLAAVACILAFILTSPYLLADLRVMDRDLDQQVFHLTGGHFGSESQRPGPIFYVNRMLAPAFGWPGFLLALGGLVAAAFLPRGEGRRRGVWLVLLVAFLGFYLVLSLLQTRFERYMLPALLPLALGLAGGWRLFTAPGVLPTRIPATAVLAAVLVLVAIPPALGTARFLAGQGQPSTLQLAREWILATRLGQDSYLAMELYTPDLPRERQLALRREDPAFEHLDAEQRSRFLDLEVVRVVHLPFYHTKRGASDPFYDLRHYLGYDLVVTSSAVRGRHESRPDLYPRQVTFYRDLERYAPPVRVFAPEGARRGPEIRIHPITDQTRRRIAEEKGALTQDFFRQAAGQVVGSHFRDFLRTVAMHARDRGYPTLAALYYQPLYETTPPATRDALLPDYATALAQAGQWERALPLLDRWATLSPLDPRPEGYLGQIHEGLVDFDSAREHYRRCLELAARDNEAFADPILARWAAQRLRELKGDSGDGGGP